MYVVQSTCAVLLMTNAYNQYTLDMNSSYSTEYVSTSLVEEESGYRDCMVCMYTHFMIRQIHSFSRRLWLYCSLVLFLCRWLTPDMVRELAGTGRFVFLKDTSLHIDTMVAKLRAAQSVPNSPLK